MTGRSVMHRPFVRAAMVLALLVCVLTVHGRHTDDAAHSASASVFDQSPAVLADDPAARGALVGSTVDTGHHPTGNSCAMIAAVDRSSAVSVSSQGGTVLPPVAVDSDTSTAHAPDRVLRSGRSLLLLRCVSRR